MNKFAVMVVAWLAASASPALANDDDAYVYCSAELVGEGIVKLTSVLIAPQGTIRTLERGYLSDLVRRGSSPNDWKVACEEFAERASADASRYSLVRRLEASNVSVSSGFFGTIVSGKNGAPDRVVKLGDGTSLHAPDNDVRTTSSSPSAPDQSIPGKERADGERGAIANATSTNDLGDLIFYLTTSIKPLSDPPTYNSMCVSNVIRRKAKGWPNNHEDAERIIKNYHSTFLTLCRGQGATIVDVNPPRVSWNAQGRSLDEMRTLQRQVAEHPQNIEVKGL